MKHVTSFAVEEHIHGETTWIAVRSRGADWSWLTPAEAVHLGRAWIEKYGCATEQDGLRDARMSDRVMEAKASP